jgi:hypothetical protein
MKVDPNKKLTWESKQEYQYRQKTQIIVTKLKEGLNILQEANKNLNLDYDKPKKIFEDALNLVKNNIPKTYSISNQKVITAVTCYIKACEILKNAVNSKDTKSIYRASNKIQEGNIYFELSKLKLWQDVDRRVTRNNKRGK